MPVRRPRRAPVVLLIAATLAAAAPAPAVARGGDGDRVRTERRCGQAARVRLELRGRDGEIAVRFGLERGRARESWRVVVVRDGRVVQRAVRRLDGSGRFEVRFSLRDLPGGDRVRGRAVGPRGTVCEAEGTLRG
ncbi:hypothetical protein [Patulibacter americanus]|uniref:hypothetical protein n=1 Tax=Patulibacter americanus TaxID=588672 RepID=UPI0003B3E61F|nr:hypothetical protein [Patulibacter americanus]